MAASQDLDSPLDYIVVGGGTTGLVVASRLSEDAEVRVLVVEAGGDRTADPRVLTPGLVAGVYGKDEGVLDAWGALGNEGWAFDDLAPYFPKFGTEHAPPQSAKDVVGLDYHDDTLSGDGPLQPSCGEGYNPSNAAWMQTFAKLSLCATGDPRSGKAFGVFQNPCSIDPETKTRSYSASAYYGPDVAKRPNLVLLTETLVKKINFDTANGDVCATGVQIVTQDGQERTVSARLEAIPAAGALQTPQLLELSDVGGKDLLESLGIPVAVENPSVGENLQDHPIVCQSFEVNDGVPSADVLRDGNILNAVVGQYQATREGPFGQSTISSAYTPLADINGIVSEDGKKTIFSNFESCVDSPSRKLVQALVERPDEPSSQHLLFPSQIIINDNPANMAEYILSSLPENYMTVMTILNHPFSRGKVHITGPDYNVLPSWDPQYNSNALDLELLARNVQFVERIVGTEPFRALLKEGGKRLRPIKGDDLNSAKAIVRQRQISVFHVSGSCSMQPREQGGVVNSRLRVYGTKRLRVVDASIFPIEPLGNIQSTVYAVAEKAADLIKYYRKGTNIQNVIGGAGKSWDMFLSAATLIPCSLRS